MAPKLRLTYNAPVILTFALAATVVQIFGDAARPYFAAYPELDGWRSWFGLFSHILGHANWDHLLGNFTIILLVGPILEERHGSLPLLAMIAVTALVTGLVNVAFSNHILVGASGIAFMFVILASLANIKHGDIPLTFIAVALLFMGREVVASFNNDNISHMAHLLGGAVGAGFGFLAARNKPATGVPIAVAKQAAIPPPKAIGKSSR